MNLKLLEPAFYTNKYGIESELKSFLLEITKYFAEKEYSDTINKISLVTAIAPNEEFDKGLWKEEIKCWPKSHDCFVCGRINFDDYHNSTIDKKKELIVINILKAIKRLEKKVRINYCAFKNDLKLFLERNNYEYIIKSLDEI